MFKIKLIKIIILIIILNLIILLSNKNLYANNTFNFKLSYTNPIQGLEYKNNMGFGVDYRIQENNLLCYLQNLDYLLYSNFQIGFDITQLGNENYILSNHFDILFINKFFYVTNPYVGISPALNYYIFSESRNTMTFGIDFIAGSILEIKNDLNLLGEFRYSVTDIGNCQMNVLKFFVGFQIKI
jgi:hypothetical protein